MIIKSSLKNYEVSVNNDFSVIKRLSIDEASYVVIDKNVFDIYGDELFGNIPSNQIYIFNAAEENKTIESALEICEIMTNIPAKRNARLISFGGGIVQDVTGFVANILYRGIHWTFFPTTLLAACDSCIGGKTSLNYKSYKNLLGTFYPPDQIFICTPFFKSLSERDFESGLGEVVKFNVMFGKTGISKMEQNIDELLQRDDKKLETFVYNSLLFKKAYIEQDEFDRDIRINLNYAHTFGHAFETMSNYAIPHGTAVAMGTVVANRISLNRGLLDDRIVTRIENILWKIINIDLHDIEPDMDKIIAAIRKDKKQISTDLTAVLMNRDMSLTVVHDVKADEISNAIGYLFEHLRRN